MYSRSVPRHQLSKSTFMYGVQCPKRVWLNKNLPKERDVQTSHQTRIFQQGADVGLLAQELFPGGINAAPENYYSYQKSVADTTRYIRSGHQIIYEAAFQYEGVMCALDILVKVNSKWYAYEVKSTNGVKEAHIYDAALQYFVIKNAGIDLEDFSIIHLNKNYIRQGELNSCQLFQSVSVLKEVKELNPFIASKSIQLLEVLSKNTPPGIAIGAHCNSPYPCDFQGFCNKGISPFENRVNETLNDKDQLTAFSNSLKYPVRYLSLQTWSSAVPLFDGHSPYKQVCFQYSLHKQQAPGAPLEHFHFLEVGMNSQQKELLCSLIESSGENGSIVIHGNSFLNYHLQELKKKYSDLDRAISGLQSRLIKLPPPFLVDFKTQEMFRKCPTVLDPIEKAGNQPAVFSILDSSSASAAYFNLKEEKDENRIEAVRNALSAYGENSSLDMAKMVCNKSGSPLPVSS